MLAIKSEVHKILSSNPKVKFDYNILNTWEAGISLLSTEVKSILVSSASIKHAYAAVEDGQVFIINMNIPKCIYSRENHEPIRKRRLLLHKREINKMIRAHDKFHTLVPMQVHITSKRKIKVLIALCEGKTRIDKRRSIMDKEMARLADRISKKVMH